MDYNLIEDLFFFFLPYSRLWGGAVSMFTLFPGYMPPPARGMTMES